MLPALNILLRRAITNTPFTIAFITANPPESAQTDISLSQYLAIQEKGVSAWEFEPELEIANCFVEARTEIEFFDSECTVMCNLPVPKQNEVYYWEAKIYDKPEQTLLSIGMCTKPYPLFRIPGTLVLFALDPTRPILTELQASTSPRLPIYRAACGDITNPSTRQHMDLNMSKVTSLALVTAPELARFSLREMAGNWMMWRTG